MSNFEAQEPTIISHSEHTLSAHAISSNALSVLHGLNKAGYCAYLVGGSVRDLLLEHQPKDFDIATNALPEQVRMVFRHCRLIGRRFRLAHVYFKNEIIEVATFRRGIAPDITHEDHAHSEHGMIMRDNVYGTMAEDAMRRDFTVNALYYNVIDDSVVDYTTLAMNDLATRTLRMIGSPAARYREDPVRMLRAIRFANKLSFKLEKETEAPLYELAPLLSNVAPARLFEEYIKLFFAGNALTTFKQLYHFNLFKQLYPSTDAHLQSDNRFANNLIEHALKNTDTRIAENKPVTPAFLLAIFLWLPYKDTLNDLHNKTKKPLYILQGDALQLTMSAQRQHVSVPRRYVAMITDIWGLQARLVAHPRKKIHKLLSHRRFRAAYDFLVLRAQSGETEVAQAATWWTQLQDVSQSTRKQMIRALPSSVAKSAPHNEHKGA